ncbi:dATP pyrophosphohydrolase [Vibrio crassostreae]|uniref:NUDIX hydrolase n=1 Tax=Vibrio crassostreae TaxID=246167 RepID=UPI000F478A8A|nr:NUDIX pyrophosphatase [Vibrio crassostreae]ROR26877.1 dATP pyrophosphohydrolase [Vibrio crassostreae]TCN77103.1 dATP pyrophosphohydrolase [Vibrio crassostreae]TWD32511.1 dATP pyrophosphohydrolase [Vibrio crassostreae]TWD67610.1 dATP pyrophosphohydrolase [Vibrio crassostreae]
MRAPFQVLVFPYQMVNNKPCYLIARRSDNGVWQVVSGGGEGNESIQESAERELFEETKLIGLNWQLLDSMCMLPKTYYAGNQNWNDHRYVIPEYCFSVQVKTEPCLSNEHKQYRWCYYKEAKEILEYDSNRIALWEANQRLSGSTSLNQL